MEPAKHLHLPRQKSLRPKRLHLHRLQKRPHRPRLRKRPHLLRLQKRPHRPRLQKRLQPHHPSQKRPLVDLQHLKRHLRLLLNQKLKKDPPAKLKLNPWVLPAKLRVSPWAPLARLNPALNPNLNPLLKLSSPAQLNLQQRKNFILGFAISATLWYPAPHPVKLPGTKIQSPVNLP